MIIDLAAEIKKRKPNSHKEETIAMLKKVIFEIEQGNIEECLIIYSDGVDFTYHHNSGSAIKFMGLLELTKDKIANG